jgi:integrase
MLHLFGDQDFSNLRSCVPVVIQRMLRHSSKDMTMHYVHAKAREAQEQYIAELGIAAGAKSDSGCSLRVQ